MADTVITSTLADSVLALMVVNGYFGLGVNATDSTVECAGTDYARVAFTASTDVGVAEDYSESAVVVGRDQPSAVVIDFGTVGTGGWGTIYWLQFFAASSGGTPIMAAKLPTPQVTAAGNTITMPIGNLKFIAKGGTAA